MNQTQNSSNAANGNKPTVNDIARLAGVSLATVDRVLNSRSGVRTVTIERVNKAIEELGYVRDTAAANLARRRFYNLLFILPDTRDQFIQALQQQIVLQSQMLSNERTSLQTVRVAAFDSQIIASTLDALQVESSDGVAIIAPETPVVRDAIARTRLRGIAVVALLSDLPSSGRDHFIGIDNMAAGKTAARLMGRFVHSQDGCILVLTGARLARDHLERRHGFDSVVAQQFPHLKVLPSIEANDEELANRILPAAFRTWPNICGIYSSRAGNNGLISYLQDVEYNPVVIAHELTAESRTALEQGLFDAIISQDTGHIVRSAVRLLRATADATPFNAAQEIIRIDIFLKENLPPNQTLISKAQNSQRVATR